MIHPSRIKSSRNADGSIKTLDQILRSTLKLREYGQYLATQQKSN